VGSLLTFDIPQTALVATLDTYDFNVYGVHLSNDTLSIAFENTVFSLIPKENATVSKGSFLKWRARSIDQ
jgi:hypothetical protein